MPGRMRWGVAAGAAAVAFGAWWWARPVRRPFVYVTRVGAAGPETLRLAEIEGGKGKTPAVARVVKTLDEVPGAEPTSDVPETFVRLVPSPGNRRMAVLSTQMGLDFIDHNVAVFDLVKRTIDGGFNEHRFSGISRATFSSARFEEFLAAMAADGVPASDLASYDWAVLLEGSASAGIPWPDLAWADDDTLVAAFTFEVASVNPPTELGTETFRFRITPSAGTTTFQQWTAPMPPPPPAGPLSIGPVARPLPHAIRYKGKMLPFVKAWTLPGGPKLRASYRSARMVAGLVG